MCMQLLQQPDQFAAAVRDNYRMSLTGGPAPAPATVEAALHLAETVVNSLVMQPDLDEIETFWSATGGGRAAQLPSDDLITGVVKALVRSVRDVLGDEWSSMTGSEWAAVQLWLIPHLTSGAQQARAAGLGSPPAAEPSAEDTAEGPWPAQGLPAKDSPDPASRHDRKRRGVVRRSSSDGEEWVP
jgi:hypothetical protein